ncbi:hypothetical protein ACIOMM_31100 [Streptomyces sp. NPDC087908]|uniref:hypothetical protein n=1 Tax=Streptomyces sp. NPDC087908 TaxID=3365820 RepID=UPI00382EF179
MSAAAPSVEDEVLVGRCYTKARRLPLMIGRWPGGRGAIWGGPYTVPQVVVIAVAFGVLMLTRGVWAHFGLVNLVIAIGVPYGLSLVVRHVHIDGRNPLVAAVSAGGSLVAPAGGRLEGRPVKSAGRYRPLVGVCSVTWVEETSGSSRMAAESTVAQPAPAVAGGPPAVAERVGTRGGRRVTTAATLLALRQEQMRTRGRGVDNEQGCER